MISRVLAWCVPDKALRWGWLTHGDPLMARLAVRASELVAGTAITGYMRRVGGFQPGGVISTAEAERRAAAVVERITPAPSADWVPRTGGRFANRKSEPFRGVKRER